MKLQYLELRELAVNGNAVMVEACWGGGVSMPIFESFGVYDGVEVG